MPLAGGRREHQPVRLDVPDGRLEREQLIPQHGEHVNLPDTSVGLRCPHRDRAASDIDITPAELQHLADPQAGEHERGEHRPPRHMPPVPTRGPVQLTGRVQQRLDVLGPVQPHRRRPGRLEPLRVLDRVTVDQPPSLRALEDLTEPGDRLVDRHGRQLALTDLRSRVPVDLPRGDLRQPVLAEVRQQVVRELPLIVQLGALAPAAFVVVVPLGGELEERRVLLLGLDRRCGCWCAVRWLPDATLDIRQRVPERLLSPLA
ncbi:MAG TPA: hypothetical protein VFP55_09125 [Solirubrobacteraceae bacterium]|nr:hypothetical protein [Solirubrobacteraceae bacterium]